MLITSRSSLDRLGVFCFIPFLREVLLQPLPELIEAAKADHTLQIVDAFEEYRALGGKSLTSNGTSHHAHAGLSDVST